MVDGEQAQLRPDNLRLLGGGVETTDRDKASPDFREVAGCNITGQTLHCQLEARDQNITRNAAHRGPR